MKKQEFLNELGKRFKYIGKIIYNDYGFDNFKKCEIKVVMIEDVMYGIVHEEMVSFWMQNEGKPNEKILDVRWKGLSSEFNEEIVGILDDAKVYYRPDKTIGA